MRAVTDREPALSAIDPELRSDVRRVSTLLGESLVRQGGQRLLDLVEQVRVQVKQARTESSPDAAAAARDTLTGLDLDDATALVRAFATYFQLANTAEQVHRVRSIDAAEADSGWLERAVAAIVAEGGPELLAETIGETDLLAPGMHINAVGGDCPGKTELHADVLRQAQVFVEYAPQTRIEGDIQQLPADFAVTELWEVLAGQHAGRAGDAAVTVFDSVGFALEDFSALRFLRDAAAELGMGQPMELIPELSDPKDLFAVLRSRSPALRAVA